jgi:hypothetical protein
MFESDFHSSQFAVKIEDASFVLCGDLIVAKTKMPAVLWLLAFSFATLVFS